jgi:predicted phosphodiesterase
MKIRVMSDLHIEFFSFEPEAVQADVIVLAGNILTEHYGLDWARRAFAAMFPNA